MVISLHSVKVNRICSRLFFDIVVHVGMDVVVSTTFILLFIFNIFHLDVPPITTTATLPTTTKTSTTEKPTTTTTTEKPTTTTTTKHQTTPIPITTTLPLDTAHSSMRASFYLTITLLVLIVEILKYN